MPNRSYLKHSLNNPTDYYSNIHHHFDLDAHNIFANSQKIAMEQLSELTQDSSGPLIQKKLENVVDIGCGTGNMLLMLNGEFKLNHIYGVDLSAEMLEIAKAKIPHLITICDSAANIKQYFEKPNVNLLISHFLFAYVDYRNLLMQYSKITTSGSLISICSTTSNTFSKTGNSFTQNLPRTMRLIKFLFNIDGQDAINSYSKFMPKDINELQDELKQNGYQILNAENIHFTITLKSWKEAWNFFHDGSWFVGIMKQYKVNKFKMFCIFNFLKLAGLFKSSNGIFKDNMEVVVITAIRT